MRTRKIYGTRGRPDRYYVDGKEVTEDVYEAHLPNKPASKAGECSLSGWSQPILSDALAVHPDQIQEARDKAIRLEVPTDFTPDGRPILTSREHRRRYMQRVEGCHDKSGGYGDG